MAGVSYGACRHVVAQCSRDRSGQWACHLHGHRVFGIGPGLCNGKNKYVISFGVFICSVVSGARQTLHIYPGFAVLLKTVHSLQPRS